MDGFFLFEAAVMYMPKDEDKPTLVNFNQGVPNMPVRNVELVIARNDAEARLRVARMLPGNVPDSVEILIRPFR